MRDKTFSEFAKSRELTAGEFPHANTGLALLGATVSSAKATAWLFFGSAALSGCSAVMSFMVDSVSKAGLPSITAYPNQALSSASDDLLVNVLTAIGKPASEALSILSSLMSAMSSFTLYFTFALAIAYMFVVVLRWRCYERDCLANDWRARKLKSDLIRRLNVNARLREVKRKNSNSNGDLSINVSDEIEALTNLKKMRVHVNTRQSLDSDQIEQRYQIALDVPHVQSAADKLADITKSLDQVAAKCTKGVVTFGAMTTSADRSVMMLQDSVIVPDKYDYGVEEVVEDTEEYESSFPMSLLIDKQAEINEIKDKAASWSTKTAKALSVLLVSAKEPAKLLKYNVGNSNALFTYELPLQLQLKSFDKYGELIDQAFKTSGSKVEISEGQLLITIPLRSDLKVPINVPTMYREHFG